jgi:hypothetical protein
MTEALQSIVRTLFWESAETPDFSLARLLQMRAETRILPLAIKICPECYPVRLRLDH